MTAAPAGQLRIVIKMNGNLDDFEAENRLPKFIADLSSVSGCRIEQITDVVLKRGCVIFLGNMEQEAAKTVYELFRALKELPDGECPAELQPLRDFIDSYEITEVKIQRITTVNIIKRTSDEDLNAVCLIHGWNGGTDSFGKLPEFIRERTGLPILTYSYPTSLVGNVPALHFISENLDNWVRNNTLSPTRRVMFVGHSMGGLILRKMLAQQLYRLNPIDGKLGGAVFVASPYSGVWLAGFAKKILLLGTDQVKELSSSSASLVELNSSWQIWRNRNSHLAGNIRSIYGLKDMVVAPAVAAADDPHSIPIFNAGHIDIVKPKSIDSDIVVTLSRLIRDAGLNVNDNHHKL